jgi:hypothetical protein
MTVQVKPTPLGEAIITIIVGMFFIMIAILMAAGIKWSWRLLVG